MTTVRVATYNLYLGADVTVVFDVAGADDLARRARTVRDQLLATDFPARARAIASILARERVDVVGLQEVAQWSRTVEDVGGGSRSEVWLDFLGELLEALARTGEAYDAHACTSSFRGGARVPGEAPMAVLGHNVILVRRAGGVTVTGERTGYFTRTLDVAAGAPGLVLDIARSWGWVDAELDGRRFRFVNTHLEAWNQGVRDAQRDDLLEAVGDPDAPVVVVGDFNSTPDLVGMPEQYVDAWALSGRDGDGSTCGQRADLSGDSTLDQRIDYVWVRNAEVRACWVVGAGEEDRTASGLWPSDHAGVVAEVDL